MKNITLILLIALNITLFGCKEKQKSATHLKMELQMQENENPREYVELENVVMNKNKIKEAGLFSSAKYDGYLITGKVKNSATVAKYKDLKLTVELYSKTNTAIKNETYVLYEFFEPNSSKDFSIKIDVPDTMDGFGVFVEGATPAY